MFHLHQLPPTLLLSQILIKSVCRVSIILTVSFIQGWQNQRERTPLCLVLCFSPFCITLLCFTDFGGITIFHFLCKSIPSPPKPRLCPFCRVCELIKEKLESSPSQGYLHNFIRKHLMMKKKKKKFRTEEREFVKQNSRQLSEKFGGWDTRGASLTFYLLCPYLKGVLKP